MPKTRSVVIVFTLLAVFAVAAVIWLAPDKSAETGGGSASTVSRGTGIDAVAGGFTLLEMSAVAGVGLALCFALAACVALLVNRASDRRGRTDHHNES